MALASLGSTPGLRRPHSDDASPGHYRAGASRRARSRASLLGCLAGGHSCRGRARPSSRNDDRRDCRARLVNAADCPFGGASGASFQALARSFESSSGQTASTTALISSVTTFEDRRFNHLAMNGLQFGRHSELAANDARLIGEASAIPPLAAGLLSSFVNHRRSSSASRFIAVASGFLNFNRRTSRSTTRSHCLETTLLAPSCSRAGTAPSGAPCQVSNLTRKGPGTTLTGASRVSVVPRGADRPSRTQ